MQIVKGLTEKSFMVYFCGWMCSHFYCKLQKYKTTVRKFRDIRQRYTSYTNTTCLLAFAHIHRHLNTHKFTALSEIGKKCNFITSNDKFSGQAKYLYKVKWCCCSHLRHIWHDCIFCHPCRMTLSSFDWFLDLFSKFVHFQNVKHKIQSAEPLTIICSKTALHDILCSENFFFRI